MWGIIMSSILLNIGISSKSKDWNAIKRVFSDPLMLTNINLKDAVHPSGRTSESPFPSLMQHSCPMRITPHLSHFTLELANGNTQDLCRLLAVATGMTQNIGHMGLVIFLQCR